MMSIIILPTQLFDYPKSFWNQYNQVIVYEEPYYINKSMHPMKLWFHRASMTEYFDTIDHPNKKYITYDKKITITKSMSIANPIDKKMIAKFKICNIIDSKMFLLQTADVEEYRGKSLSQITFYKNMRKQFKILIDSKDNPIGGKWSFDESNRKRFPNDYKEESIPTYKSKWINEAKSIIDLSDHNFDISDMIYPTNRKNAMSHLRLFIENKLKLFGPYQDAMKEEVVLGYHSNLSAVLNIGLITPMDVIKELEKYKNIPIASLEGFIRQIVGWREYMRVVYHLHDKDVNHFKYVDAKNKLPKSWFSATTNFESLDTCIQKVKRYAYAHHIERLMLINNYGVLLELKYADLKKWFIQMFIDGYDWVMTNVAMNTNSVNPKIKFMKRVYLTNGNYLKKMGLKVSKDEMSQMNDLYKGFLIKYKSLLKSDYVMSGQISRISKQIKK